VSEIKLLKLEFCYRKQAEDLELHQGERIIPLEVISTPIFDEDG
jgi:hypothetical protein